MAQTILYYPNINIQNDVWLRNALLYWDQISSIVPYENYPHLSDNLMYLKECEIYKPILAQDVLCSEYAGDFVKKVINRLEYHRKRRNNRAERKCLRQEDGAVKMQTAEIHMNKMYTPALYQRDGSILSLHDYLVDNGFLDKKNYSGWTQMDKRASLIYMRTFAEFAVKCCSEDMVIGTDNVVNQDELYHKTGRKKNAACVSLSLEGCLPHPSGEVSFDDLLNFKERHKGEFLEFRSRLREFEKVLSQCEDLRDIRFETESFKEDWQRILIQNEKMFTRERVTFVLGSLAALVNAPSTAESVEKLIQKVGVTYNSSVASALLLGGTAAINVGYNFRNYKNKVNDKRSSEGFSYLLKASEENIINFYK